MSAANIAFVNPFAKIRPHRPLGFQNHAESKSAR
jgi:hypothetical protein